MGRNTKISWADHSWNAWIGCTQVSAGCDHCYAKDFAERLGMAKWGHGEPRTRTKPPHWKKPLIWDREAAELGIRYRVFANSMSDWADKEVPTEWRTDLFNLIRSTPNLDWLMLTKRHNLARKYLPKIPLRNVRIGFTVEDQAAADMRMMYLAKLGLDGWQTFVSYEPALGPVDWWPWLDPEGLAGDYIHQIICGAESGTGRRPFNEDWARAARDACQRAGVAFFYKQIIVDGKKIETPELDGHRWTEHPEPKVAA